MQKFIFPDKMPKRKAKEDGKVVKRLKKGEIPKGTKIRQEDIEAGQPTRLVFRGEKCMANIFFGSKNVIRIVKEISSHESRFFATISYAFAIYTVQLLDKSVHFL